MLGTTLGHYRILESLGKGGMGEVYLAQDLTLDRRVALKVLAKALAGDADRRERFVREAKAIAALNHPNIVTVHSVEREGDVHFLTMELVDGFTLQEVIRDGTNSSGLNLDRVLDLAIPLADAVAAAHERGITHRDLKPANVMVTPSGRLKVLDFGLAKLAPAGLQGTDETALGPAPLTGEGRIVGTVSYMSPEQAEGKAVDHRSDIFSLGVMLYELATGAKPFTGETSLSVLAAIVKDTPRPVTELNPRVPRELGRVIRRCLAKDQDQRFQNAKDLRNELQELQRDLASGELAAPAPAVASSPAPPGRRSGSRTAIWIAGAAVVAAIAFGLLRDRGVAPAATANITFEQLTFQAGLEVVPSLSPDGKWFVYAAGPIGSFDIMLQGVGGQNAINLTKDSPVHDSQPAFSPNGEHIAFRSNRQGGGIFVMGRTGEFVRRVTDTGFSPSWSPDGTTLAYATEFAQMPYGRAGVSQLWTVNVASGEKRLVSNGDAMEPRWSPNGRLIAYWAVPEGTARRDLFVIPAAGGTPVAVTSDEPLDSNPIWAPDGRSLYFVSDRGGSLNLWQIAVDAESGAPAGRPSPITTPASYVNNLSLSADGSQLAFASSTTTTNVRRLPFDVVAGATSGDGSWVTRGSRQLIDLDVSPDGQRLVYRVGITQEDLVIIQVDGTREQQLTSDRARDRYPRWAPDGKQISFYSDRSGQYEVWTIAPDGGSLRQISDSRNGVDLGWAVWSPDGTRMVATDPRTFVVSIFNPNVPGTAQKVEQVPAVPGDGRRFTAWSWSPDGRRIAGSVANMITVYDLTTKTYKTFDNAPGADPRWLPDSRRIVASNAQTVFLVDTTTGAIKTVVPAGTDQIRSIALSTDGRQLFVAQGAFETDIWMAKLK